jgi:uncharacterized protein (TIGR02231 family)
MALPDQLALFDSLRARMGELDGEIQEKQLQKRHMQRHVEKLVNELKHWQGVPRRESYTAHLEVEVLTPGELTVELVYLVSGLAGSPLRFPAGEAGNAACSKLIIGTVSQRSGEAWQEVALALSTARPTLAGRLPELAPWFVGPLPPPIIHAGMPASAEPMRAKPVQAAAMFAMEVRDAGFVQAEVDTHGAAVSYRVPASVSIPADGTPHKVVVTRLRLEPQLVRNSSQIS